MKYEERYGHITEKQEKHDQESDSDAKGNGLDWSRIPLVPPTVEIAEILKRAYRQAA